MKLLDKIKNAIFEEEEFDEDFVNNKSFEPKIEEELVKKIDVEKTITKTRPIKEQPVKVEEENQIINDPKLEKSRLKRETRRTPIIFDEEDFEYEKPVSRKKPVEKKEEKKYEEPEKKPLYGGFKDEKPREKFKPSPVISPVYGFVGISPILEQKRPTSPNEEREKHIFIQEEPEKVSLDDVRQKAFGYHREEVPIIEEEEVGLLYEMEKDDTPAISKVTIGDAEEYFEDLGLEYNVDYKDDEKEKAKKTEVQKNTRSIKNKQLSETIDKTIEKEEEKLLESTRDLEITKEQLRPKTAEEIKKVKKIEDRELSSKEDDDIEEKNLYDLIDMMYDSK